MIAFISIVLVVWAAHNYVSETRVEKARQTMLMQRMHDRLTGEYDDDEFYW